MTWKPLQAGDLLYPWDMVWVDLGSRVELRLLREGPLRIVDASIEVIDANRNPSGRIRLFESTYLIVHPLYYEAIEVSKVVGTSRRASDPNQVQAYYQKHGARWGRPKFVDRAEYFEWRRLMERGERE